jgi:hypothetical protein
MTMIVGKVPTPYASKYDFQKGETLGEEISEALKAAEYEREKPITADVRNDIERLFDKVFEGSEINASELAKFLNSDLRSFFSVYSENGYHRNFQLLSDMVEGNLGVAVSADAKRYGQAMLTWMSASDDFTLDLIKGNGGDEKFTQIAMQAMAVMADSGYQGRHYHDESDLTISAADLAILLDSKRAFKGNKDNIAELEGFIACLAPDQTVAKAKLTQMLNDVK